jgi:tetratricopeptide (TPR) repeat protein
MRLATAVIALAASIPAFAEGDDELIRRLGSAEWKDREAATRECLERPGLRPALESALHSPDPEVRLRARHILDCRDWGLDGRMVEELGNPFEGWSELDEEAKQACLLLVSGFNGPGRVGVFLNVLRRTESGDLRSTALSHLRDERPGSREWAKARLASPDPVERTGAALALALWRDNSGAADLRREVQSATPLFGKKETIDALIAIGDPAGLDAALDALRQSIRAGKPPAAEMVEQVSAAPLGTAVVEGILMEIVETAWPAGVDSAAARTAALAGLRRCAGPGVAARLVAVWEKTPDGRLEELTLAFSLADVPALQALAPRVEAVLGAEKANADQLFILAAFERLAGRAEARRDVVLRLVEKEELPKGFERVAEVALYFMEAGEPKAADAYLKRALEAGVDEEDPLFLLQREAQKAAGIEKEWEISPDMNNESWHLVTQPDRLPHPGLAVRLSEWTVGKRMNDLTALAPRGTLGAAYYRAGRLEDAVKTLEYNLERPYEGKQEDMAFLAMAYKKLGRVEDARKVDARCREWEKDYPTPNPLRPEMERVLSEP